MTVFGKMYADVYDTIYNTKNYNQEVDFLEEIFHKFAKTPAHTVLDLGCGTGGHSLVLDQRGYQVCGVDLSQEMLDLARRKAAALNRGGEWVQGDIRTVKVGKVFDAAVMMFAVLSYQTQNEDLQATLSNVAAHLAPGGLFTADFWYGPAVLAQRPSDRVAEWNQDGKRILRLVQSKLDSFNQTVRVQYRVLELSGIQLQRETIEVHEMRYLFPQELGYFLTQAGFKVLHWCPFLKIDGEPGEETWNVSVVAQKEG